MKWISPFKTTSALLGLDTGLIDLNNLTGGWFTGLNILAARPSMGKTGLCLRFIQAALDTLPKRTNRPILQLGNALKTNCIPACSFNRQAQHTRSFRSGKLDDEGWAKLAAAVAKINELAIA